MENKENKKCCPEFDPSIWDKKTNVWQDKLFIKDEVAQIFHMPLNISKVIGRMWKKVEEAGASPELKDFLMLSYDPSPWKSEMFITTTKEVPNAENVKISGTFISKVFDGPYNMIPKFYKEMEAYVAEQGKKIKKQYFYFTYCPKCSKEYKHNYIVSFAEIEK